MHFFDCTLYVRAPLHSFCVHFFSHLRRHCSLTTVRSRTLYALSRGRAKSLCTYDVTCHFCRVTYPRVTEIANFLRSRPICSHLLPFQLLNNILATANGHAVIAASYEGGSGGTGQQQQQQQHRPLNQPDDQHPRRSNQLKLQESAPKFLTIEVLSSKDKATVTVDGVTVSVAIKSPSSLSHRLSFSCRK